MVGRRPLVLGLTGSIAMGKSEATQIFRRLRVPVVDAGAEVHRLMAPGGRGVDAVVAAFPAVLVEGRIDRQKLRATVFDDTPALQRLEAILHPLVGRARGTFLRRARALGGLGDASAVSAIEKRVKGSMFSSPPTGVRIAGLSALASIGTPHAMSLVKKARTDKDPEVSSAAAQLLAGN